jgi:hypothetical protein
LVRANLPFAISEISVSKERCQRVNKQRERVALQATCPVDYLVLEVMIASATFFGASV